MPIKMTAYWYVVRLPGISQWDNLAVKFWRAADWYVQQHSCVKVLIHFVVLCTNINVWVKWLQGVNWIACPLISRTHVWLSYHWVWPWMVTWVCLVSDRVVWDCVWEHCWLSFTRACSSASSPNPQELLLLSAQLILQVWRLSYTPYINAVQLVIIHPKS